MNDFYEHDSTKVSLREYWWGTRSPAIIVAAIIKGFRIRIPTSSDDPNAESTLPFVVVGLPEAVAQGFDLFAGELEKCGFRDPVYHVFEDVGSQTTIYWATFLHESGQHFARIHQRFWQKAQKVNRGIFPLFFTEFADGTFMVSSAGKPDWVTPTQVRMNRMHGASVEALWVKHQEWVGASTNPSGMRMSQTHSELLEASERHHILVRDFHLARGVFRARTLAERAKVDAFAAKLEEVRASGVENAEVVAELAKLQEQSSNWKTGIWILVGSAVLFLAAGMARGNWKFTLWLIPALLFHEAGHWIAMRIFRYRNLRMFFIPFFGAAVSGQHWNVPGWKKALVSLAGPLPGILLGAVLGVAGALLKKPFLNEASLTFLILNGYNLLPILPLDGGHVMQAILFCRNRWLDLSFRIMAILGLIGLGAVGMGKSLVYVAIPMAITLPLAFALGKVVENLRRNPPPEPASGEDRIPPETAQVIINAVKGAFPKGVGATALAQHSLAVFESLNAKPPGKMVTLLLLMAHGAGALFAVLFGAFLVVTKHGTIGDFIDAAARQPLHTVDCGSIRSGSETESGIESPHRATSVLIATLADGTKAAKVFDDLGNQRPASTSLTLFGDSLMFAFPASDDALREQWFDRLQVWSTNTFIAISNNPVSLSLTFFAPTDRIAKKIEQEFEDYFGVAPEMGLIPPWSPAAQKPGFESFVKARRAWQRISRESSRAWTNAEVESLNEKITTASKRGALGEVKRLGEARKKALDTINAKAREALKNDADLGSYRELITLEEQLSGLSFTNQMERAAILRQVAPQLGVILTGTNVEFSVNGVPKLHGLLMEIAWFSISDPEHQLPELVTWLCGQGCTGIHYRFSGSIGLGREEGDEQ